MQIRILSTLALVSKASYWRGVVDDPLPYPTDPSAYREPETVQFYQTQTQNYAENAPFDSSNRISNDFSQNSDFDPNNLPYPTVNPDHEGWAPTTANFPKNHEVYTVVDDSPPSHKELVQMGDIKMDQMSNIRSSWSQCHIHGNIILIILHIHRINEPFKPHERAKIRLFRELLSKILASSGAEIWLFLSAKGDILDLRPNHEKSGVFLVKMAISRLWRKLKSSVKAL